MGRKGVDSNERFFENFEIPLEDRLGEEGRGFEYILHGMNPERILIAAELVGLGRCAVSRAAARFFEPHARATSATTSATASTLRFFARAATAGFIA